MEVMSVTQAWSGSATEYENQQSVDNVHLVNNER
jgi:hypothetical protein